MKVFHTPNFDFEAPDNVFEALKMNNRSVDRPALKALKAAKKPEELTLEDVKSCLVAGATFRVPLANEPDGGQEICTGCGRLAQPIKYMAKNAEDQPEERGNFLELKAEKLTVAQKEHPELVEAARTLTAKLVGGEANLPKFALAIFVCENCKRAERRDRVFRTYYSRTGVLEHLGERETRIRAAIRRNTLNDLLGSKRRDPRARREMNERFGGGFRGRDNRPKPELAEFDGARFHRATAEAFTKAKAANPTFGLADVVAMSAAELAGIGAIRSAEQTGAVEAIRSIAKAALMPTATPVPYTSVKDSLSIPLSERDGGAELEKLRGRRKLAGKHTGRKGERFNKKSKED
jgi:hypothetical protein